ncbi:MAG: 1-acyl-sn-glycerol-3-phosphate acyltransferase [Muribaculaceae bacterium]|nr:1-acyl-sn-glycerol-3-phosphate acyltransferase [Muribaculaceae bacterium]
MNISSILLKLAGWRLHITTPDFPRSIICVAPHTSNWDFIIGKLAYSAVNRKAGFLMKSSWFFFPLGYIFKAIGGIPVYRKVKHGSLVEQLIAKFRGSERLNIAITPEGTRKKTTHWHTGFLRIAYEANVPIQLGVLDYKTKTVDISEVFISTGDTERDLKLIKKFYTPYEGKYPDKFTTEDE